MHGRIFAVVILFSVPAIALVALRQGGGPIRRSMAADVGPTVTVEKQPAGTSAEAARGQAVGAKLLK